MILGQSAQEQLDNYGGDCRLSDDQKIMDAALAAIYDESDYGDDSGSGGKRGASLGKSAPQLAKWLGDIRCYFTEDVVAVIQNDAIERKGLTQLLFETGSVEKCGTEHCAGRRHHGA